MRIRFKGRMSLSNWQDEKGIGNIISYPTFKNLICLIVAVEVAGVCPNIQLYGPSSYF